MLDAADGIPSRWSPFAQEGESGRFRDDMLGKASESLVGVHYLLAR
jgi:hypothetical protein